MENGLRLGVKGERGLRGARGLEAELDAAETEGLHREVGAVGQVLANIEKFCGVLWMYFTHPLPPLKRGDRTLFPS